MDRFQQIHKVHCLICKNNDVNNKINNNICIKCHNKFYKEYKDFLINGAIKQAGLNKEKYLII